jgi:hypothetical protein
VLELVRLLCILLLLLLLRLECCDCCCCGCCECYALLIEVLPMRHAMRRRRRTALLKVPGYPRSLRGRLFRCSKYHSMELKRTYEVGFALHLCWWWHHRGHHRVAAGQQLADLTGASTANVQMMPCKAPQGGMLLLHGQGSESNQTGSTAG